MGMRIFSSPKYPDWLCGPTSLLCNRYQGFFLAVKQPGSDDNYLPPLLSMSGMTGAIPLPYMPSWPGQGKLNLYVLYNKTYQMKVFCWSQNILIKTVLHFFGFLTPSSDGLRIKPEVKQDVQIQHFDKTITQ
jgi:hypothetical protein